MTNEKLYTLRFNNINAVPRVTEVFVSKSSVAPVMAWYGGYFAGDVYTVTLDGQKLEKDKNGELKWSYVTKEHP